MLPNSEMLLLYRRERNCEMSHSEVGSITSQPRNVHVKVKMLGEFGISMSAYNKHVDGVCGIDKLACARAAVLSFRPRSIHG